MTSILKRRHWGWALIVIAWGSLTHNPLFAADDKIFVGRNENLVVQIDVAGDAITIKILQKNGKPPFTILNDSMHALRQTGPVILPFDPTMESSDKSLPGKIDAQKSPSLKTYEISSGTSVEVLPIFLGKEIIFVDRAGSYYKVAIESGTRYDSARNVITFKPSTPTAPEEVRSFSDLFTLDFVDRVKRRVSGDWVKIPGAMALADLPKLEAKNVNAKMSGDSVAEGASANGGLTESKPAQTRENKPFNKSDVGAGWKFYDSKSGDFTSIADQAFKEGGVSLEETAFYQGVNASEQISMNGQESVRVLSFVATGNEGKGQTWVRIERNGAAYWILATKNDAFMQDPKSTSPFWKIETLNDPHGGRMRLLTIDGIERKIDLDRVELEVPVKKEFGLANNTDLEILNAFADYRKEIVPQVPADMKLTRAQQDVLHRIQIMRANGNMQPIIIVAENESGRKTVVAELAKSLPRSWRLPMITPESVAEGTTLRGMMEARLKQIKSAFEKTTSIPIIPNLEELALHKDGDKSLLQSFNAIARKGDFPAICITTADGLSRAKMANPAFFTRAQEIRLKAPAEGAEMAEVHKILQKKFEKETGKTIDIDTVDFLTAQAERFDPFASEPGRSLKLLEKVIQTVKTRGGDEVSREVLFDSVIETYNAPREIVYVEDWYKLTDTFHEFIKDRIPVISDAASYQDYMNSFKSLGMGLSMNDSAAFFLAPGKGGGGKSRFGEQLALMLNRSLKSSEGTHSKQISMAVAKEKDLFLELVGEVAEKYPYAVIVLDEIEKCTPEVQNTLLTALQSGVIEYKKYTDGSRTNSVTRKVSIAHNVIVGTTNKSADFIQDNPKATLQEIRSHMSKVSDGIPGSYTLSEPLLTRAWATIPWPLPTAEQARKGLVYMIGESVKKHFKRNRIKINVTNAEFYANEVIEKTFEEGMNYRDLETIVKNDITQAVDKGRRSWNPSQLTMDIEIGHTPPAEVCKKALIPVT